MMIDPKDTGDWEDYSPRYSSKMFWTWFGVGSVAFLMLVAGVSAYAFGGRNKPPEPAMAGTYSPSPQDSSESPSGEPSESESPSLTPSSHSTRLSPRKSTKKPRPRPKITSETPRPTFSDCKEVWRDKKRPIYSDELGWSSKLDNPVPGDPYCDLNPFSPEPEAP